MTHVAPTARLAQEEVFGPLLAVMEADDFDHAVRVANDVRFGLSASICTKDLTRALEYVQRAEAGVIKVNLPSAGIEYQIPFGGVKDSSAGPREQGPAAVRARPPCGSTRRRRRSTSSTEAALRQKQVRMERLKLEKAKKPLVATEAEIDSPLRRARGKTKLKKVFR
jgi:acyl-CoA reductase-like NAD-dependent aldehyde dehydrogenase